MNFASLSSLIDRSGLSRLVKNQHFQFALALFGAVCIAAAILLIPKERLTESAVKLLTALLWPYVVLVALILFRRQSASIISVLIEILKSGRGIKLPFVELTALEDQAQRIPQPSNDGAITLENIALLHTSFFSAEATNRFNDGHAYYQFEVIVIAPDPVMARIVSVEYLLEDAWKSRRVQLVTDRESRFKMKELANGTSIVRADVKFQDQEASLGLNRFIDLRADGPRI